MWMETRFYRVEEIRQHQEMKRCPELLRPCG
jgi:hypothetical protein